MKRARPSHPRVRSLHNIPAALDQIAGAVGSMQGVRVVHIAPYGPARLPKQASIDIRGLYGRTIVLKVANGGVSAPVFVISEDVFQTWERLIAFGATVAEGVKAPVRKTEEVV